MRSVDADIGPDEAYQHLKHSRLLHSGNIRRRLPPPPPTASPTPSTKLESIAAATLCDSSATKLEKKGRIERKRRRRREKFVLYGCGCRTWITMVRICAIVDTKPTSFAPTFHIHCIPQTGFFISIIFYPLFFLFPLYSYFLCRKNGRHLFSTALNFSSLSISNIKLQ